MNADELAAIRDGLAEAKGAKYDVMQRLFAHIDTLTAVAVQLAGKAEELEAERDTALDGWASALDARDEALTERDTARAEVAALRRVVDADIEVADAYQAMRSWEGKPSEGSYGEYSRRFDAADKARDEAIAAYRAEWR